jgi:hypothetical protein
VFLEIGSCLQELKYLLLGDVVDGYDAILFHNPINVFV